MTHRTAGWTGHTHGAQHVYGETYGKMTRKLGTLADGDDPTTTAELLHYKDARPQFGNSNAPVCL